MVTANELRPRAEDAAFERLDWVLVSVAAGIWGASFLFIDIGLDAFAPGVVTLLRVAFGSLAIMLVPAARRPVERSDYRRIALLGATWMAIPLTLFPIAEQWISSSMAGMLNSAMPLMTVLVAAVLFATPTAARRLFGVVVGFVGILLISLPEVTGSDGSPLGVALVVAAVVSYGVAVNLAVPLQQKYGSVPVLARALAVALVLVLPYGIAGLDESSFAWGPFVACFVLGAGGTGLAFAFAATLAGRVGAVRASILTYLMPIISIVLGVVFRDEKVTVWALSGTVIVLVGAWLTSRVDQPGRRS